MRHKPTKGEKRFRELLFKNNIRHYTQYIIGKYIVDFVVGWVIIEIDGKSHLGQEDYDNERTNFLNSRGYDVIRVKNSEVEDFVFERLKTNLPHIHGKFKKKKKKINHTPFERYQPKYN